MRAVAASLALASVATAAFVTAPPLRAAPSPARARVACMAKAQKPVDANGVEIKAAVSAYMHFCAERRPALTAELKAAKGDDFKMPAVMSALGAEWKALGDAKQSSYKAKAAEDKRRYDAAFASNPENAKIKKPKRKSPKSSGPRKLSAYMHFCAERRPSLTAELKASMGASFKNPAVMVALGAEWKAIDEAGKAKYQAMAAQPVA